MIVLVHSLYMDKLLGLETLDYDVPDDVKGLELNDEIQEWLTFLAALAGPSARDELISLVADGLGSELEFRVVGEERTSWPGPRVGGTFAVLALANMGSGSHQKRDNMNHLLETVAVVDEDGNVVPDANWLNSASSHSLGVAGAITALLSMVWFWLPMAY